MSIENYIQDANALLPRLIENTEIVFFYLTPDSQIVLSNKSAAALVGKTKEEMLGKNISEVLYSFDNSGTKQQMFKAVLDDCVRYKRSNDFESLFGAQESEYRHIFWNINAVLDDASNLNGILLIGYDITKLEERSAALKKIDETLKNIFASIKDYALYVTNLDGNITYYGMGSEMMFGWQKKDIIFKNVSVLHRDYDVKEKLRDILLEVNTSDQRDIEIEMVKKDGQGFPVELTVSKFVDDAGKITGYVFIAKDITERKKLEYQIFQSEKLAAIGQLAAGMAHEINNPLFVISGRLEMILEQQDLAQDIRDGVTIAHAQADRIRKLVDQLLKFARKTPPKHESFTLNSVIESVLPLLMYHKLPAAKVIIEKSLCENPGMIQGDFNQLQEVFINLLINAHQAMPEGGTVYITSTNVRNVFTEVKITDTGMGIDEKSLRSLFMPFYTTKKEGTGLGLSICYNIVKGHNGTMEVESQVGKGTTFTVRFPIV